MKYNSMKAIIEKHNFIGGSSYSLYLCRVNGPQLSFLSNAVARKLTEVTEDVQCY